MFAARDGLCFVARVLGEFSSNSDPTVAPKICIRATARFQTPGRRGKRDQLNLCTECCCLLASWSATPKDSQISTQLRRQKVSWERIMKEGLCRIKSTSQVSLACDSRIFFIATTDISSCRDEGRVCCCNRLCDHCTSVFSPL